LVGWLVSVGRSVGQSYFCDFVWFSLSHAEM